MMKIKKGAMINGIHPEIVLGFTVANAVYEEYGLDCVLTSGTDGKHGTASLHYVGYAFDIRTRDFDSEEDTINAAKDIQERLGKQFDVVVESNHMHIEFQPK